MNKLITKTQLESDYINAFIIFHYLKLFSELEKIIKCIFVESLQNLNKDTYSKICFYVGGIQSNGTYINYIKNTLESNPIKFDNKQINNSLTLNAIIKLDEVEKIVTKFNLEIKSLRYNGLVFSFHECCKKLIDMRNIIAHKIEYVFLNDKYVIEQLNINHIENIQIKWLTNIDITQIDQSGLNMLSNYVYMFQIFQILQKI